MNIQKVHSSVWEISHPNPLEWLENIGQPVLANAPILINHCATSAFLGSDLLEYKNDFGTEYEVNVHNYSTKNKS